jgi:hypothetical protein
MQVFLGDEVTVTREVSGELTLISGRVAGLVQKDNGDLKYFYIRGIDTALYLSDGWRFDDEEFIMEIEKEEEDNG